MELVLEAIRELGTGDVLKVLHRREPHMLYPMLEKLGFKWLCKKQADAQFIILIWHHQDTRTEMTALSNTGQSAT